MGQLLITKEITNEIWSVHIDLQREYLSEADKQLVKKFKQPLINVGGTFLEDEDEEYILPDKFIKVFSGLPYTQEFDTSSGTFEDDTEVKVDAWLDTFLDRYRDAMTTLRASQDNFTGQAIEQF